VSSLAPTEFLDNPIHTVKDIYRDQTIETTYIDIEIPGVCYHLEPHIPMVHIFALRDREVGWKDSNTVVEKEKESQLVN
jgi:hypothetical protein